MKHLKSAVLHESPHHHVWELLPLLGSLLLAVLVSAIGYYTSPEQHHHAGVMLDGEDSQCTTTKGTDSMKWSTQETQRRISSMLTSEYGDGEVWHEDGETIWHFQVSVGSFGAYGVAHSEVIAKDRVELLLEGLTKYAKRDEGFYGTKKAIPNPTP